MQNATLWDDIRSSGASVQSRQDSAVVRVNETLRLAHVLTINPTVSFGHLGLSAEVASFLAIQHLNERSGTVLPHLPERLKDCDLRFTATLYDSQAQPTPAVQKLLSAIPVLPSLEKPYPMGIIGTAYSIPSESLAIIGGVRDVPQCSCCARSRDLDNRAEHPLFTRAMPSSEGDSRAAAHYFHSLGVTHVAVLHVTDLFARHFAKDFAAEATELDMQTFFATYVAADVSSAQAAINQIKASGIKYIYSILFIEDIATFADLASRAGIMGQDGYVWFVAQGATGVTELESTVMPEHAVRALHGFGSVVLHTPESSRYNEALESFKTDKALQQYYISKQVSTS